MRNKQLFFMVLLAIGLFVSCWSIESSADSKGCNHNNWGPFTVTKQPTCVSKGRMESHCQKAGCGAHWYQDIEPTGIHERVDATCQTPSKCKNCSYVYDPALKPHHYVGATCVTKGYCYMCGKEGSKGLHDWKPATCITPMKCRTCNTTVGQPNGHNYVNGVCTVCNRHEESINKNPDETV